VHKIRLFLPPNAPKCVYRAGSPRLPSCIKWEGKSSEGEWKGEIEDEEGRTQGIGPPFYETGCIAAGGTKNEELTCSVSVTNCAWVCVLSCVGLFLFRVQVRNTKYAIQSVLAVACSVCINFLVDCNVSRHEKMRASEYVYSAWRVVLEHTWDWEIISNNNVQQRCCATPLWLLFTARDSHGSWKLEVVRN